MLDRLRHRGPDSKGIQGDERCILGAVRLKIIDLSDAANQPFEDPTGRFVLSYNGEVYNYVELRKELEQLGVNFRTKSDTEVVLASLVQWGIDGLKRFNGMFALALYDRRDRRLLIAVDRYGIKSLYHTTANGLFVFASEIKAIIPLLGKKPTVNPAAVFDFLAYGATNYSTDTMLEGVSVIEPGHLLILENGGLRDLRWWEFAPARGSRNPEPRKAAERIKELLENSVRIRMRSDVPVGSCLSGGIDSSAIVVMAASQPILPQPLELFTVSFPDSSVDETPFARMANERSNGSLHLINPTPQDFVDVFDHLVYYIEEPGGGPSLFAQWCVMQEAARQRVTVLLDGQGSDELFAGYHYFFGFYLRGVLASGRIGTFVSEAMHYLLKHRSLYAFRVLAFLSAPRKLEAYRVRRARWIAPAFRKERFRLSTYLGYVLGAHTLSEALHKHLTIRLRHLLIWEDHNSCAHSIESRLPFLDDDLVDYVLSLPEDFLIRHGETKWILRLALRGVVPNEILNRQDKMGFETPNAEWLRHPAVFSWARAVFSTNGCKQRGYYSSEELMKMMDEHFQGKKDHSVPLWRVLFLEGWFRVFVDSEQPDKVGQIPVRPPLESQPPTLQEV